MHHHVVVHALGLLDAEPAGIVERDALGQGGGKGLRVLSADAKADAGAVGGAVGVEVAAEPSIFFGGVGIGGRMPDFGGAEVGQYIEREAKLEPSQWPRSQV